MEISLVTIHETPVFTVPDISPNWKRVYGATPDVAKQRWLFPAFSPFLANVLHDIEKVYKDISFSTEATQWINNQKNQEEWRALVDSTDRVIPSYDHQSEGLAELLCNYRWILQWETGTGKTKVVIDAVDILKCKTLTLCPLVALDNWVTETKKHSGGALSALAINGASKAKKLEQLSIAKDYDIVTVTFDTARTYGVPTLYAQAANVFKHAGRIPGSKLKNALKRINDSKIQTRLAQEWIQGKPPREIVPEVAELIAGKPQWLTDLDYHMLVADESHRIKRIQSQRTKICLQLSRKTARRVLLSGTLTLGDPRDLFPQLRFLAPYLVKEDWKTFCNTYLVKSPKDDRIVVGYKNLHILNSRVANISSNRKLEECVDMPERRFETVKFELSAAQRRDYNYVVKEWAIERPDAEAIEIQNGAIRVAKLLQICSGFVYIPKDISICNTCSHLRKCVFAGTQPGTAQCIKRNEIKPGAHDSLRYSDNPKLTVVTDMLEDIVSTSKTIIWANFQQELDDIESMLQRKKWGYVRVDGSNTQHVQRLAKQFNEKDSCRIYLAQISTGIAITLNAAQYMMYYSRSWSLEDRKQSLGRNFRIGQNKKTIVYDFCAARTLELQQVTALNNKDDIAHLLTTKINCVLCRNYRECTKKEIVPWANGCILKTGVSRVIARARTI